MGATQSRPRPRHRSLHSRIAATALFDNCTEHIVHIKWVDYKGEHKTYRILSPGEKYRQDTYCCHPWQFIFETDGKLLTAQNQQVVYMMPGENHFQIIEASTLEWNQCSHVYFPFEFQQQVKAFLLSHHRSHAHLVEVHCRYQSRSFHNLFFRKIFQYFLGDPDCKVTDCSITNYCAYSPSSFGQLPKEIIIRILGLAAPLILDITKPCFPYGAESTDFSDEDRSYLFCG